MIGVYVGLILTLILMIVGADNLVNGATSLARRFRISEFVIGALIVGIGTSLPELTVSVYGAIENNSDVAIGNVVGSNIFNILGILGLTSLIYPLSISKTNVKFDLWYCIFVSCLVTLLAFNFLITPFSPFLSRFDGLILLMAFGLYIYCSFQKDKTEEPYINNINQPSLITSIINIVGGLVLLIISSRSFVDNAVTLARNWNISESFISLTIIACGTSLPELMASVIAAIKKNNDIAFGNIVGSNIFNIAFILGVASQLHPLTNGGITWFDYIIMIASALILIPLAYFGKNNKILWFLVAMGVYWLYAIFITSSLIYIRSRLV